MPNKLVEYVAAPFPLTLSPSKGERSHNLGVATGTPIAPFNAKEHEVTQQ